MIRQCIPGSDFTPVCLSLLDEKQGQFCKIQDGLLNSSTAKKEMLQFLVGKNRDCAATNVQTRYYALQQDRPHIPRGKQTVMTYMKLKNVESAPVGE